MRNSGKLNIVAALPCEARWFLDKYHLSRVNNASNYPIYSDKEANIHLIVSGVGKIKSAAALSYLHAFSGKDESTCYLNAGIAGARARAVGELFLAHKIIDAGSGRAFYPLPMLVEHFPSLPVLTVDKPLAQYPDDLLVEMEAAGFHQAALNFVTQEQVHTLKIVADNIENPLQQVCSKQVIDLFIQHSLAIEKIVAHLLNLSTAEASILMPPEYFTNFIEAFHFTDYQRHQLRELLRRWQINFPKDNPLMSCAAAKNAKMVFTVLENQLATVRLCR